MGDGDVEPLPGPSAETEFSGSSVLHSVGERSEARRGRGRRPPLEANIEFVVVGGEERRALHERQAASVREALQWFYDNPPSRLSQGAEVSISDI